MKNNKNVILIVDDIEMNRVILKELFKDEYIVYEACDGEEALGLINKLKESIDIILLDIIMPKVDGFEVLEELNSSGLMDKIPVFLVTAADAADMINKGYDMGVQDIVQKPFNPNIIKRRVKNAIELYNRRFRMEDTIFKQSEEIKLQDEKLKEQSLSIIDSLSTVVEFRDLESGEHVKRLRQITQLLLTEISKVKPEYGFTPALIETISIAAVMHDIGKIAIPDNILNKPGKLTDEEFEIMKTHTVKGCEMLDSFKDIFDNENYEYYYGICRWHHEKWDGRGYPDGLKGDDIPIWAQVVSIADCFDALISPRVYKPPYEPVVAVEMILNGECGQFNPILLDCFKKVSDTLINFVTKDSDAIA